MKLKNFNMELTTKTIYTPADRHMYEILSYRLSELADIEIEQEGGSGEMPVVFLTSERTFIKTPLWGENPSVIYVYIKEPARKDIAVPVSSTGITLTTCDVVNWNGIITEYCNVRGHVTDKCILRLATEEEKRDYKELHEHY